MVCVIPCEANCGYCDIEGKCIRCSLGYSLDVITKECTEKCNPKCVGCT